MVLQFDQRGDGLDRKAKIAGVADEAQLFQIGAAIAAHSALGDGGGNLVVAGGQRFVGPHQVTLIELCAERMVRKLLEAKPKLL